VLSAKPGTQDELLQALRGLTADIRNMPGCTACILGHDVAGGPHFIIYVCWVDAPSLQAAMASEPFRVLLGAASTLGDLDPLRTSVAGSGTPPARLERPRGARAS
jgi:quinol monooxygenase YgiN